MWSSNIKDTPFMLARVPPFECLQGSEVAPQLRETLTSGSDSLIWRRTAKVKAESWLRHGERQLHFEFLAL